MTADGTAAAAYRANGEETGAANGRGTRLTALVERPGAERLVFLLCVVAGLVPMWAVERFPSVDGPMHLYVVHIIDQLLQPGANPFDRIFQFNYNIEPNLAVYGIIWSFSQIFPMLVAEKLFVSLYWLLFAGGAYYLLRSFGSRAAVLGLLLLPFALGYFLHWGFYNFVLSQALFLIAAGYSVRHLEQLRARDVAVLGLLMLALALTHLVGIAMFLFYIGLFRTGIAVRDALSAFGPDHRASAARRLLRDAGLLLLAALPALAIMASFFLRRVLSDEGAAPELNLVQKIWYVGSVSPIFSVDKREAIALAAFTLVLWALVLKLLVELWKDPALRLRALPALLPFGLLAAFAVIGSLGFAGFNALPRLLPFLFFMLIIALGTLRVAAAWRGAIMVAVAGGLIATSWLHLSFYRQVNALYADFSRSRRSPAPHSAVLAFNTTLQQREVAGRPTGWRVNVTDHFRTGYARERNLLMLNVVHLAPQIYGYFPVSYRPDVNVAAAYSARQFRPPATPLRHFEGTAGLPVSEVSFWPLLESEPHVDFNLEEREPLLRAELASGWQLLPRTSPAAPFIYVEEPARPGGQPARAALRN